jgi:DNA polymerase-3 subunit beta
MKFTIPAGEFVDGLKSVQARAKSNSLELLKHIRFVVAGSRLTLLGHDQSSSSEAYLAVDAGVDGACAVPSDSIVRLVASLPRAAHVVIEREEFQITIKTGRSRYKLPVMVSDDFPDPLPCEAPASVNLDAKAIAQLFDRPRAALDPRETRAFCLGAYIHSADGVLCAAATDGKHFTRYSSEVRFPDLVGVIVPMSALEEISKLGPGKLSVSERSVAYETATRRYCSKLIDSKYIDYNRGIPQLIENYVEVDRAELLACFQRLASVAKADSQLHLSVGDGEIVLSLAGMGEGVETLRCSGEALPDSFVAASAEQFIDAMKMLNGEVLQLHIGPKMSAFRIVDAFEATAIVAQSTQIPKMRAAA